MSKAFIKEESDRAAEVLPDREISPHANLVTEEGMAQIEAAIEKLQKELGITSASDTSVARDLRYWTAQLARAQLTANSDPSQVKFGSRVTVRRDDGSKETYRIVGMDEADPKQGTLSYISPLAQALMDREVADSVQIGGIRREITEIS